MKPEIQLVYFKRDLRLRDHEALAFAQNTELPCLLFYLFDDFLFDDPHYGDRHWRFIIDSIKDLNKQLAPYATKIHCSRGEVISVMNWLNENFNIRQIASYQEVGLSNTFHRDLELKRYCKNNDIHWQEFPYAGVIRAAISRDGWDKNWKEVMRAEQANFDPRQVTFVNLENNEVLNELDESTPHFELMQKGGEEQAWKVMHSFYKERGKDYYKLISKPAESRKACSRLSPYLAWGNLSLRQSYQHLLEHWKEKGWPRSLSGLSSRLHWHCHFIQKFESECEMEFRCLNQAYEHFPYRTDDKVEADLQAWKIGHTGFPLIDACMRCLHETGYINFRMRAMLVSFLCHHLLIDWRLGVKHLAELFLDFEPGIHYPQFQMQAGVIGVNTVRIYNPVKQSQDHDPHGNFIRKYLPELRKIPSPQIHEPWNILELEALTYDFELGKTYPKPLVDLKTSYKRAQDLLWSWRKRPDVITESQRILARHVRARKK